MADPVHCRGIGGKAHRSHLSESLKRPLLRKMDSPFFHGVTCFKDIINLAVKTQLFELIQRRINHLGAVGTLLRFRLSDAYNMFRPSVHTQYAERVFIENASRF